MPNKKLRAPAPRGVAVLQRMRRQAYRDLRVLARLFPWQIGLALAAGTGVAALLFQRAYNNTTSGTGMVRLSYVKAIYAILNMAAFQVTFADMPSGPYLDAFFVVVPLISLPLLLVFGANLFHIVRVFFVRRERGQIWQRALAGTVSRPIVVCGLGHIGYRVATQLIDLQRPIIGIETTESTLTQTLIDQNVPVILGDVRDKEALRSAGVARATTVIVCTHNDMANIEAVFHVREMNPGARVVLRLFQDELADEMVRHFDTQHILSRSAIAAQDFAYAALGLEVLETFRVRGETYALVEIPISVHCPLLGTRLSHVSAVPLSTVVCLYRDGNLITEPALDLTLRVGDALFIFTHTGQLAHLLDREEQGNQERGAKDRPILVCGLGHTGYRVVEVLRSIGRSVHALDFAPTPLSEQLAANGISVSYGDFRTLAVLQGEGVETAEALIACTADDMVNFETAIRAQAACVKAPPTTAVAESGASGGTTAAPATFEPGIRTVIRIFEDALGHKLQEAFGIDAVISSSARAAPAFVAAALDIGLTKSVLVGGTPMLLARMTVESLTTLLREPIGDLTREGDVIVLLHQRGDRVAIPPDPSSELRSGDELVVLATRDQLRALASTIGVSATPGTSR